MYIYLYCTCWFFGLIFFFFFWVFFLPSRCLRVSTASCTQYDALHCPTVISYITSVRGEAIVRARRRSSPIIQIIYIHIVIFIKHSSTVGEETKRLMGSRPRSRARGDGDMTPDRRRWRKPIYTRRQHVRAQSAFPWREPEPRKQTRSAQQKANTATDTIRIIYECVYR